MDARLDPHRFNGFLPEVRLIAGYARQVWRLVPWFQRFSFFIAAGLLSLVALCNVAFPLLLGKLVDRVKDGGDEGALLRTAAEILGVIAGLYVLREFVQIVRRFLVESSCTKLEHGMAVRVIGQLMKADLSTFTQDKIGALQGRIGRSCVGFVRFIRLTLLDLLPPFLTGAFAVVAVMTKQPALAVVMLGVVPLSLWLTVRQLASQKGVRLRLIRGREQIDGTVVELLGGIDYVRAAHTEGHEVKRLAAAARDLRKIERRHHFEMSLFGAARALNEGLFHILVLGMAVYMAIHGHISYGDILTFSMLFMSVMAPLNEVHRGLDEGHECSLYVSDLLAMLQQPADRSFDTKPAAPKLIRGGPLLTAENLRVEYPTPGGSRTALDGLSLTIRHGETLGLAGPSGCGKTTLLRVLLRLTHPTAGVVKVAGLPLDRLSRSDVGGLVGYVGQNPFVVHGTIADNIAYGVPNPTRERVIEAAKRAYIHDEILSMPGGYDAVVAERGANLSGGQRQRLALARIFLKDPPVLILDEGTSALDTISERRIKQAIDRARKDRTVIMVAHRLSTLRDADRILVFEAGKVVDQGTYTELACRDGMFAELIRCSEMTDDNPARPPAYAAS